MPQQSERFEFRSPLLRKSEYWSQLPMLLGRWLAIGWVVVLVVGLSVVIGLELLPKAGVGYALYWFHDYVVLTFIGYAWTWKYPFSLIWCVFAAIVLLAWLVTYLLRRSLVRRPHAALCRLVVAGVVRWEAAVSGTIRIIDFFDRLGLGADLLQEVVRLQHFEALVSLVGTTRMPAPARTCLRLIRLSRLLACLRSMPDASLAGRLWALALWHQSFIWTERRRGGALSLAHSDSISAELNAALDQILKRTAFDPSSDTPHALDGNRFAADLKRLADPSSAAFQDLAFVAVSSTSRLREFRNVLHRLQNPRLRRSVALPDVPGSGNEAAAKIAAIQASGHLSLNVALHIAARSGDSAQAFAFVETLEAIRLAASVVSTN